MNKDQIIEWLQANDYESLLKSQIPLLSEYANYKLGNFTAVLQPKSNFLLAQVYYRLGRYEDAIRVYSSMEIDADIYTNIQASKASIGSQLDDNHDLESYASLFNKSLKLAIDKDYDKSLELLQQSADMLATEEDVGDLLLPLQVQKAYLYLCKGQYDQSIEDLSKLDSELDAIYNFNEQLAQFYNGNVEEGISVGRHGQVLVPEGIELDAFGNPAVAQKMSVYQKETLMFNQLLLAIQRGETVSLDDYKIFGNSGRELILSLLTGTGSVEGSETVDLVSALVRASCYITERRYKLALAVLEPFSNQQNAQDLIKYCQQKASGTSVSSESFSLESLSQSLKSKPKALRKRKPKSLPKKYNPEKEADPNRWKPKKALQGSRVEGGGIGETGSAKVTLVKKPEDEVQAKLNALKKAKKGKRR